MTYVRVPFVYMPILAIIAKLLVFRKLHQKPAVAPAKLQKNSTLHVSDLFNSGMKKRSACQNNLSGTFVFMSDLHSSYVNAFIAISRSSEVL